MWTCIGCSASSSDDKITRCNSCGRTRDDGVTSVAPAQVVDCGVISSSSVLASSVHEVVIDPSGIFKYIQIRVTGNNGVGERILIRGHTHCKYHDDILQMYRQPLLAISGVTNVTCIGGGRIDIEEGHGARVYGHSIGYGRCDHSLTADALRRVMPEIDLNQITWDNEGY